MLVFIAPEKRTGTVVTAGLLGVPIAALVNDTILDCDELPPAVEGA
jgi:RecJ-like exonuclease